MVKSYPSREQLKKDFLRESPNRVVSFIVAFLLLYTLVKVFKFEEQLDLFNNFWGTIIFFFVLFLLESALFKFFLRLKTK
jgi:hypothetical protein